jgi:fructoselysine-6-P-deglycase FrlB-like protein
LSFIDYLPPQKIDMAPSHYDAELKNLDTTYEAALAADITTIKAAIAGASESSIIGVGSGGSFTVASLLCNLHETYTGRVSRPSTPLEIICNPTLAAASPVFLVSAEGKNPDVVEALERARRHSARAVHVLTNRSASPLIERAKRLSDISTHIFELVQKDGYLATNSLLLDAVLVARAYGELDKDKDQVPPSIDDLMLGEETIDLWLSGTDDFVTSAVGRKGVIVTFSPLLRPVASDLESKLSESALLHCQLADLRSFAHGRHLWLADRPNDCAILTLIEPSLQILWESMRHLLPPEVPTLTMPFGGAKPRDLLAGLVAEMKLVSAIARKAGKDPGKPDVPQFGIDLHYADLPNLIPPPRDEPNGAEQSKYEVLGARWPSVERRGSMRRALAGFKAALEQQVFRSIVFDYDGVLCSSQRHDSPPPMPIIDHLIGLVENGVIVGIASGRGGSIQEHLQASLPESMWKKVQLGLYNCGYISDVATTPNQKETSEFLSHVTRIVGRLKALGVPIDNVRTTHPYQVSVRFRRGVNVEGNWFVIADALGQAGLDMSRVVRSKHSVDILAPGVNKSHLIAHVVQRFKVDPYQVLTMGDQGAWPGNDFSLLEHRFSLSVDQPSRRLDRGWKVAPTHKRDLDATLWYLERVRFREGGEFTIDLTTSTQTGE